MKIQGSRTPTRRATLVVPMLVCLLVVGCTGRSGSSASHPQQQPASAWPTHGWRTATPTQEGMDPAVLDDLDTKVPAYHSQVRSLLVVRHGYLVYERYCTGSTPPTARSSTRSPRASPRRWSASPWPSGT
jgi:hypothetical protein